MTAVVGNSITRNPNGRFKGGLNGDRPIMLSEILTVLAALGFTGGGGSAIVQSILDGDTTHSPSSDVLFDALAGKVNNQAGLGLSQNSFTNGEKAKLALLDIIDGAINLKDGSGNRYLITVDATGFVIATPNP